MAVSKCGICNAIIPGTIISNQRKVCENCKYGLEKNDIEYSETELKTETLKLNLENKDPEYFAGLKKYSEILNEYFYDKQKKKSILTHPAIISLIPVIIINLIFRNPFSYMTAELIRYFSNGFQSSVLGFFFEEFIAWFIMSTVVYIPSILFFVFRRTTLTFDEISALKEKAFSKEDMSEQREKIMEKIVQESREKSTVRCPSCNSLDIQFMQNNKKAFSVGKAVGGAVLTGGVGTIAGFAGKKGDDQWRCNDCGHVFTTKKQ